MTVKQAKDYVRSRLGEKFSPGESDAIFRIIIQDTLHWSTVDIVLREQIELPDFFEEKLHDIVARLLNDEPIQLIMGSTIFHGHRFKVTPATLIPRPETQQLVDIILDENNMTDLRVLDIGTGSGCIAVSLALALKFAQITAIDISCDAIDVAKANAVAHGVKVDFRQCDILDTRQLPAGRFDIIVSNPPYVLNGEKPSIADAVINFEPHNALFVPSDDDPQIFNRQITKYAAAHLETGRRLYLEINQQLGRQTLNVVTQCGLEAALLKDYKGNDRFVVAQKR